MLEPSTCLFDFGTLVASPKPEKLVTRALWQRWLGLISEETLARSIADLAAEAGVEFRDPERGDLASVVPGFPFPHLPDASRRALVILVAVLANIEPAPLVPLLDNECLEELLRSKNPMMLVTDEIWETWAEGLKTCNAQKRKISEIALSLGLQWPTTRDAECLEKYLGLKLREIAELRGFGLSKVRTIISCTGFAVHEANVAIVDTRENLKSSHAPTQSQSPITNVPSGPPRTLMGVLEELLSKLNGNHCEVLKLRSGIRCAKPMTLEEVGDRRGVTRERIRQIESVALRKLGNNSLRTELRTALSAEVDVIWGRFENRESVVRAETAETTLLRKLEPEYRLAFQICQLSVTDYLDEVATRVTQGWHRSHIDRYLLDRLIFELDGDDCGPFPAPLAVVAQRIDTTVSSVKLAAGLSDNLVVFHDYLWQGRLGERGRRSIWLHRILASVSDRVSATTDELVAIHNRMRPQAACNYREAEIVLARYAHLFVHMGKGAWAGAGGTPLSLATEDNEADEHPLTYDEDDEKDRCYTVDPNSATGVIIAILREFGPLRMGDITDLFEARTDHQSTSVGPILITYGEFIRLAPGVYALPDQLSDDEALANARDLLLNEDACTEYVRALRSGEARGTFPLWTSHMEHIWCQWAKDSADPEVYESLLSQIEPGWWEHTSVAECVKWGEMKEKLSAYHLDGDVCMTLPNKEVTLRELLVPARFAAFQGVLGWAIINRLQGRRYNDRKAIAYLGLVAAAGVVEAPSDWRRPHPASVKAHDLIAALLQELQEAGRLRWESRVGQRLLDQITEGLSQPKGWLNKEMANELLGILPSGRMHSESVAQKTSSAIVKIGMAIAHVDGHLDEREIQRVRKHALENLGRFRDGAVPLIDTIIERTREQIPDAVAIASELSKTFVGREKNDLMKHLFQIAVADGVFRKTEGELLIRLQRIFDIDPEYFEMLYRTHAKDPRAAAEGLSDELRKPESTTNIDELVALLTLG